MYEGFGYILKAKLINKVARKRKNRSIRNRVGGKIESALNFGPKKRLERRSDSKAPTLIRNKATKRSKKKGKDNCHQRQDQQLNSKILKLRIFRNIFNTR